MTGSGMAAGTGAGTAVRRVPQPGECDAWWIRVVPREGWLDLLDADEKAQTERFKVEHARATYVTSRAAQRLVGAQYLGLSPAEVRIDRTCEHCGRDHGRPRFAAADASAESIPTADSTATSTKSGAGPVDYSVSHTQSWVVIAVVGSGLVGVDIESARQPRAHEDLAQSVLTPAEQERINAAPPPIRAAEFLRLWTRKEATVKLTGHGIAVALDKIDAAGPCAVVEEPAPKGWPRTPIHLLDVPGWDAHVMSLASTEPIRSVITPDARTELGRAQVVQGAQGPE